MSYQKVVLGVLKFPSQPKHTCHFLVSLEAAEILRMARYQFEFINLELNELCSLLGAFYCTLLCGVFCTPYSGLFQAISLIYHY